MREMISTGLNRYDGKVLAVGERFEADDAHVRTLTLSRKARPADDGEATPVAKVGEYQTRDLVAGGRKQRAPKQ